MAAAPDRTRRNRNHRRCAVRRRVGVAQVLPVGGCARLRERKLVEASLLRWTRDIWNPDLVVHLGPKFGNRQRGELVLTTVCGDGLRDLGTVLPQLNDHAVDSDFVGVLDSVAIVIAPDSVADFDRCLVTECLHIAEAVCLAEEAR